MGNVEPECIQGSVLVISSLGGDDFETRFHLIFDHPSLSDFLRQKVLHRGKEHAVGRNKFNLTYNGSDPGRILFAGRLMQ